MRRIFFKLQLLVGAWALVEHRQAGKPTAAGRSVCENGLWSEATVEQLLTGAREPDVQCAREPPCVRWSWVRARRTPPGGWRLLRRSRADNVRALQDAAGG
jgi:hypothetical protein